MGAFTVTVLGSSGSYASTDNPCTGYLLRSDDANVLLDCGPGTLGPLQREIDPSELTAVVLTHCHPDHWLELPVLRNVLTWFSPRTGLPVYGTAQTRAMDAALTVRADGSDEALKWSVIDATAEIQVGDQSFRFARTDHPVETLAVRADSGGRSFAFSSDTGPDWSLTALGTDVDLAFCEASHLSSKENRGIPHLSAREAGERGREAGVGRLVVTHLIPGSDPDTHRAEAEAAYGGPVEVALPGLRFDV